MAVQPYQKVAPGVRADQRSLGRWHAMLANRAPRTPKVKLDTGFLVIAAECERMTYLLGA